MGVARSKIGASPTTPAGKWTEESKLDEMADASNSCIETLKGPTCKGGRGSDEEFDREREATRCWRIERWKDLGRDLEFAEEADGPGFVSTSPSSCKRLTQQEEVELGEGTRVTNGGGNKIRSRGPGPPGRMDGHPSVKGAKGNKEDELRHGEREYSRSVSKGGLSSAAAEKGGGPGLASTFPSRVKSLVQEEEGEVGEDE